MENVEQYAVFLTFAALDMTDNFSQAEYQEAFAAFPASGLAECAQALVGKAANKKKNTGTIESNHSGIRYGLSL
jgi:hypothetical protein